MIEQTMEQWLKVLSGEREIDELLHEDCVFWSPVIFRPQIGRELTKMYLSAASIVFPGDKDNESSEKEKSGSFKHSGLQIPRSLVSRPLRGVCGSKIYRDL